MSKLTAKRMNIKMPCLNEKYKIIKNALTELSLKVANAIKDVPKKLFLNPLLFSTDRSNAVMHNYCGSLCHFHISCVC